MGGGKIKEYRQKNNYSQKQLAELVGVNQRTITRWEQNKTQPNTEEAKKLMEAIGIPFSELLSDENNEPVTVLDRISDSVDNLVTGQDTINRTIESGQAEFRKHQEEIIQELRKQNEDLTRRLEENEKKIDYQKELLKQKKIRNVILIVFVIIVILLIILFICYYATYGPDAGVRYADEPVVYTNN